MGVTCPARTGPIPKLGGVSFGCALDEGHEESLVGELINGIQARDHQDENGTWWVDSIRRDKAGAIS